MERIATVANTIKRQLGVWTLADLGASDFHYYTDALQFRARILEPGTSRVRKMYVTIKLDPSDTYHVTVHYMVKRIDHVIVVDVDNIYNDQLRDIFTPAMLNRLGLEAKEKRARAEATKLIEEAPKPLAPIDFVQVGRDAYAAGEHSAPTLNATIQEHLAGRPVGDPANRVIMDNFSKGWHAANLDADTPAELALFDQPEPTPEPEEPGEPTLF